MIFFKNITLWDLLVALKFFQSPILAIIMKNPKMANIIYRQMPTPRELPQQEVVVYEIDTCLMWLLPSHCFCPQL